MRILTLAFLLLSTPAAAHDETVKACFTSSIEVDAVGFSGDVIDGREVVAAITNRTGHTLSAVDLVFEIWASDRPMPLYSGPIRSARKIAGALMDGEVAEVSDFHFMADREKEIGRNASNLSVRFRVDGAKDVEGHSLTCD